MSSDEIIKNLELFKKLSLKESVKIQAHYSEEGGNCFNIKQPAKFELEHEVKEDNEQLTSTEEKLNNWDKNRLAMGVDPTFELSHDTADDLAQLTSTDEKFNNWAKEKMQKVRDTNFELYHYIKTRNNKQFTSEKEKLNNWPKDNLHKEPMLDLGTEVEKIEEGEIPIQDMPNINRKIIKQALVKDLTSILHMINTGSIQKAKSAINTLIARIDKHL